jgi:hypothetical protein
VVTVMNFHVPNVITLFLKYTRPPSVLHLALCEIDFTQAPHSLREYRAWRDFHL